MSRPILAPSPGQIKPHSLLRGVGWAVAARWSGKRMLGVVPGVTALGRGPAGAEEHDRKDYDSPPGNAAGYMPELNVLCPLSDCSSQSDQPLQKHLVVDVAPSPTA